MFFGNLKQLLELMACILHIKLHLVNQSIWQNERVNLHLGFYGKSLLRPGISVSKSQSWNHQEGLDSVVHFNLFLCSSFNYFFPLCLDPGGATTFSKTLMWTTVLRLSVICFSIHMNCDLSCSLVDCLHLFL